MDEVTKDKPAEVPAAELDAGVEQLQKDREAFKAEAAAQNEADAVRLGAIAARPIVTGGGEVLTPKDKAEEVAYRQLHGEPSNR